MVKLGTEQPFERGITCSDGSIDHEATTSIGGGSSQDKIVVLDRDSLLRSDFESLVFRKYFDYKHLIDEYLMGIRSAPL